MARYHLFPDVLQPDATGLVARGGTLTAETVIEAHHRGIFPWSGENPIPWCAPNPRLVLFPDRFAASRSLRKLDRRASYDVVMTPCPGVPIGSLFRDGPRGCHAQQRESRWAMREEHEGPSE
jgi:Leu/Phe-tRNA-protein transferase